MERPKKKQKSAPRHDSDADRRLFLEFLDKIDTRTVLKEKQSEIVSKTKKKREIDALLQIDLHGKTVSEAKEALDSFIRSRFTHSSAFKLRVITGKGRHSGPSGGVLPREIYDHVVRTYGENIITISESPADLMIHNLPIRGYFDVELKRNGS